VAERTPAGARWGGRDSRAAEGGRQAGPRSRAAAEPVLASGKLANCDSAPVISFPETRKSISPGDGCLAMGGEVCAASDL